MPRARVRVPGRTQKKRQCRVRWGRVGRSFFAKLAVSLSGRRWGRGSLARSGRVPARRRTRRFGHFALQPGKVFTPRRTTRRQCRVRLGRHRAACQAKQGESATLPCRRSLCPGGAGGGEVLRRMAAALSAAARGVSDTLPSNRAKCSLRGALRGGSAASGSACIGRRAGQNGGERRPAALGRGEARFSPRSAHQNGHFPSSWKMSEMPRAVGEKPGEAPSTKPTFSWSGRR